MKTKKTKKTSFFQILQEKFLQRHNQMIFAAISCAFVISFAFIGFSRIEIGGNSLMASVANLNNSTNIVDFETDIALKNNAKNLEIIAGKNMENVDFVEGIIAFNPAEGLEISENSEKIILEQIAEGAYHFRIYFDNINISSGQILANFEKNSEVSIPMTFIDTQFVSGSERYNLSNIVK